MSEPVRLDAAFASVAGPTSLVERFLSEWLRWGDSDGFSFTLPRQWRIRVRALEALGIDGASVERCITTAMTRSDRGSRSSVFEYAMTAAYATAAKGLGVSADGYPSIPLPGPRSDWRSVADANAGAIMAIGPLVRNVGNGKVHRRTCRTLGSATASNFEAATGDEPADDRCAICLG